MIKYNLLFQSLFLEHFVYSSVIALTIFYNLPMCLLVSSSSGCQVLKDIDHTLLMTVTHTWPSISYIIDTLCIFNK